jgi:hypothetical protein
MTHRVFGMKFSAVYPLYVQEAEKKGRTKDEVDDVICWLTGYDRAGLARQIERGVDFATFFAEARLHDHADKITGVVCGVRVENVEDPLMKKIRLLDKVIDELARGKTVEKIKRS